MKQFRSETKEDQEKMCDLAYKPVCEKFYETEEYKSGDTLYVGYTFCCDACSFCGGMSGWIIFLIIVLVLGVLAGGAAAFWFFYWNRKFGGQEEKLKEEVENTESTENPNSVIDIPVGTY